MVEEVTMVMWMTTMRLISRVNVMEKKQLEYEEVEKTSKAELACVKLLNVQLKQRIQDEQALRKAADEGKVRAEKNIATLQATIAELRNQLSRVEAQRDEKDSLIMTKERELLSLKRDRESLESSRERERHQDKEKTLKIRRAHGLLTRSLNPDVLKEETVIDALKELQEIGITKESF